ncbi:MAG: hypothetical protein GY862_34490 [Gammaproteobacteria bacterium]|nr:hypothetical protein [Gammaproteobacteria bacterium]
MQHKSMDGFLLFSEFLAELKRQGFTVGVDHYLRLYRVLHMQGSDCRPAELKALLCPLLATSKEQQQQFYQTFDSYFARLESPGLEPPPLENKDKPATRTAPETGQADKPKWRKPSAKVLLSGILILCLAVFFGWIFGPSHKTPPIEVKQPPATPTKPVAGSDLKSLPKLECVSSAAIKTGKPKPIKEPAFYQQHWDWIRYASIFSPLILLFVILIHRLFQRVLVVQRQRSRKPPLVWPIKAHAPAPDFLKSGRFHSTVKQMQQPLSGERCRLDIAKTINRSIAQAGYPCFHFNQLKPPKYLILIDLPAYEDHYAHFLEMLANTLGQEGLFVIRYFYKNDPSLYFRRIGKGIKSVSLAGLSARYADRRLIIFGDGKHLLHPVRGGLDNWTQWFHTWSKRAILTPVLPRNWGLREKTLAQAFVVLPATLDGLAKIIDHFDGIRELALRARKWDDIKKAEADTRRPMPRGSELHDLAALRAYLGEEALFQWLCACAVYPELHWDLTLYLGRLPCMADKLISEQNLLRMIRLPWFGNGAMPENLRCALLDELDENKRSLICHAVIELLEKNPPPQGSFAFDTYEFMRMELEARELEARKLTLSRKDRGRLKRLLKHLRQSHLERRPARDRSLLRMLDSAPRIPLSFVLPRRLHKLFYPDPEGMPIFFGWSTVIGIPLAILIALTLLWQMPNTPPGTAIEKTGEPVKTTHSSILDKAQFAQYGDEVRVWAFSKQNGTLKEYLKDKVFSGKLKFQLDDCNAIIAHKSLAHELPKAISMSLVSYNVPEGAGAYIKELPGLVSDSIANIDLRPGNFREFHIAWLGKNDGTLHYATYATEIKQQGGISIKQKTGINLKLESDIGMPISKFQFNPHVLLGSRYIAVVRNNKQRFAVRFYRIGDNALEAIGDNYEVGDPIGGTGRHTWFGDTYVAIGPKMTDVNEYKYSLINRRFDFSKGVLKFFERPLSNRILLSDIMHPLGKNRVMPDTAGWLDAYQSEKGDIHIRAYVLHKYASPGIYQLDERIVERIDYSRPRSQFAWRELGYGAPPILIFLDKEEQLAVVDLQSPKKIFPILEGRTFTGFSIYPYETDEEKMADILIATRQKGNKPGPLIYWRSRERIESKPWRIIEIQH